MFMDYKINDYTNGCVVSLFVLYCVSKRTFSIQNNVYVNVNASFNYVPSFTQIAVHETYSNKPYCIDVTFIKLADSVVIILLGWAPDLRISCASTCFLKELLVRRGYCTPNKIT